MKNIPLKISILCASIFATLAVVFGVRAQYEQQKHIKTFDDVKDYMNQLLGSDIISAQREFSKKRDVLLQSAAHVPNSQVTKQETTTTIVPKKVVTPVTTTNTTSTSTSKPKAAKKTKTS